MVSYLEDSCASDTDYSESEPLRYSNHGNKNQRLPGTNAAAAVLLILVSVELGELYKTNLLVLTKRNYSRCIIRMMQYSLYTA